MKSLLLFFGFVALTCQMVNAQNAAFVNENGENLPDTVYVVHDITETVYLNENSHFTVEDGFILNKTASKIQVDLKRHVVEYASDSAYIDIWGEGDFEWVHPKDEFCWGEICTFYNAKDIDVTLGPGAIESNSKFDLSTVTHYVHYKIGGKTILEYTILNGSTVEDKLVVVYQITGSTTSKPDVNNVKASIYPNPVRGTLNISNLDKAQKVLVSNILGQPVFSTVNIESNMQVDFSNLNNGVYFVSIYYPNNKVVTQRLVKQ